MYSRQPYRFDCQLINHSDEISNTEWVSKKRIQLFSIFTRADKISSELHNIQGSRVALVNNHDRNISKVMERLA